MGVVLADLEAAEASFEGEEGRIEVVVGFRHGIAVGGCVPRLSVMVRGWWRPSFTEFVEYGTTGRSVTFATWTWGSVLVPATWWTWCVASIAGTWSYWTPWTIPGVLLDSIGLHFRVHSDSSRTISGLHMEFGKLLVDWSPPEVHGVSPESRQPMRSLTSN
jgi:hypothetical protein